MQVGCAKSTRMAPCRAWFLRLAAERFTVKHTPKHSLGKKCDTKNTLHHQNRLTVGEGLSQDIFTVKTAERTHATIGEKRQASAGNTIPKIHERYRPVRFRLRIRRLLKRHAPDFRGPLRLLISLTIFAKSLSVRSYSWIRTCSRISNPSKTS